MKQGTLYLIPTSLGDDGLSSITELTKETVQRLDFFIAENERSARRFLRSIGLKKEFSAVNLLEMNKDFPKKLDATVFKKIIEGQNAGLLSEAGLPAIADPGNYWVREAHRLGIKVQPLSGPSSILLALVASGFNGQQFRFVGYLPTKSSERIHELKKLEEISSSKNETQIFMETPYRNNSMLDDILNNCNSSTMLCIASSITLSDEFIQSKSISEWKKQKPELHHKPTVFLIYLGK